MSDIAPLGSPERPLRIAVVGSGPSGFYSTEALIRSGHAVRIDMFERLPAPYGLVRYGVAPDHPKLKQAIAVYDKIAHSAEFSYLGNVTVGRDITVDELRNTHHAVIFTCGAAADRRLDIEGEDLPGSHTATEFVAWYNGHPDYRDRQFDLSCETAVIIGQGNVAADVARILAKTAEELEHADIAAHALDVLARSAVRDIFVVGRRGPAQAKFTPKELREFGNLPNCTPVIDARDLELNAESSAELEDKGNANAGKNLELFRKFSTQATPTAPRRCHFRFLRSPVRLTGDGRVGKIVLEKNRLTGEPFHQSAEGSGETEELRCGLVFRSIGYRATPIPGVPFDEERGVIPNAGGRVVDGRGVVTGLYAAGWIKRGATGIIGTNREDSVATVEALLDDLPQLETREPKTGAEGISPLLAQRGVRVVSYRDWKEIDAVETATGEPRGKPREKLTSVAEMLAVLDAAS